MPTAINKSFMCNTKAFLQTFQVLYLNFKKDLTKFMTNTRHVKTGVKLMLYRMIHYMNIFIFNYFFFLLFLMFN